MEGWVGRMDGQKGGQLGWVGGWTDECMAARSYQYDPEVDGQTCVSLALSTLRLQLVVAYGPCLWLVLKMFHIHGSEVSERSLIT